MGVFGENEDGSDKSYGEWVQDIPVWGDVHNAFVGAPPQKLAGAGKPIPSEGRVWAPGAKRPGDMGYVHGPEQPNPNLILDPITGKYYDARSGTVYNDPYGQSVVTNPNVAQLTAQNVSKSAGYGRRAAAGDAEHAQTFRQQTALADSFNNTINNPNAPSVARVQLGQSTDALARRQMAGAAGVNGPNAFAARRLALQNIANGAAQADQSAALIRAKETSDAQSGLGTLLSGMSAGTDRRYINDAGLEKDYLDTATRAAAAREGLTFGAGEGDRGRSETRGAGFLNAWASMVGGKGGGSGGTRVDDDEPDYTKGTPNQ